MLAEPCSEDWSAHLIGTLVYSELSVTQAVTRLQLAASNVVAESISVKFWLPFLNKKSISKLKVEGRFARGTGDGVIGALFQIKTGKEIQVIIFLRKREIEQRDECLSLFFCGAIEQ